MGNTGGAPLDPVGNGFGNELGNAVGNPGVCGGLSEGAGADDVLGLVLGAPFGFVRGARGCGGRTVTVPSGVRGSLVTWAVGNTDATGGATVGSWVGLVIVATGGSGSGVSQ